MSIITGRPVADWESGAEGDGGLPLLPRGELGDRAQHEEDPGQSSVQGFDEFPGATKDGRSPSRVLLGQRVRALDGLRGMAAGAVVVFHLGFINGGWLAVDLFFTLSGFLITALLLSEWGSANRIALGGFWGRRARRLLPALALLLGLVAVLASVAGSVPATLHRQTWSTALYVSNWTAVFSPQSYWDLFTNQSPLEHTWSLAIEEQFYLVWPLVCFIVLKLGKGRTGALAAVTAALLASSFAAMWFLYTPGDDTNRVYFGTDTRAASILVGALLACWMVRRHMSRPQGTASWPELSLRARTARVSLEVAAAVALVGLGWAWVTTEGSNPLLYRGGLLAHAVAAALIIAAAVNPIRGPLARALSLTPLVWLGVISYGVYLFHWPAIWWLTPERTGIDGASLAVLRVLATLVIATASWLLIERNVLRGRIPLPRALPVVAVCGAGAVLAVLLVPAQVQPGGIDLMANSDEGAGTRAAFSLPAAPAGSSAQGFVPMPGQPPPFRVLFAGDSVPYSIAKNWQPSPDHVVTGSVAIPSCDGARGGRIRFPLNIYVSDKPDCQGWAQLWPDALALFKPDAVVLMLGTAAIQERQVDGVYTRPCERRYDSWYASELEVRLQLLEQHTTAPILLTLSPYADDRSIGVLPANHRQRTDCLNAIYRSVGGRHPTVQVVDFAGWLCPGGACRQSIDGQQFRTDGLHLSPPAAASAGEWLVEQAKLVGLARADAQAGGSPKADPVAGLAGVPS